MGPDLPYIDFTVQQHGPRDHGSQLWWHVGMGEKIFARRNREQKNDKECIIYYNLIYYNIYCMSHSLATSCDKTGFARCWHFHGLSDRVQRDWLVEVVPSLEVSHYIRSYHESEEVVLHLTSPTFTGLRILRMSSNHMSILRTQSNSVFARVCWGGLLLPAAHDSAAEPQARCTLHWVWWYILK